MLVHLFQFENEVYSTGLAPTKIIHIPDGIKEEALLSLFKKEFEEILTVTKRWDKPDRLKVCFINKLDEGKGYLAIANKEKGTTYYPISWSSMPTVLINNNGIIEEYE